MKCELQCGTCRERWRYDGPDPMGALVAHRREKHPDNVVEQVDQVIDTGENPAPEEVACPAP